MREDYNLAGGLKQYWLGFNTPLHFVERLDRVFQWRSGRDRGLGKATRGAGLR